MGLIDDILKEVNENGDKFIEDEKKKEELRREKEWNDHITENHYAYGEIHDQKALKDFLLWLVQTSYMSEKWEEKHRFGTQLMLLLTNEKDYNEVFHLLEKRSNEIKKEKENR